MVNTRSIGKPKGNIARKNTKGDSQKGSKKKPSQTANLEPFVSEDQSQSSTANMSTDMFSSVDHLWKQLIEFSSLTALYAALGPLSVTKFDYNGFSARAIISNIIDCAKAAKVEKAAFLQDLLDIILIGLSRGNIRKDQIAKTVEGTGVNRIQELSTRYKVYMKTNAQDVHNLNGNELTFTRSISVFPHLASILLFKNNSLAREGVTSVLNSAELPACMKHTGFSSLIPSSVSVEIKAVLVYAYMAYMVDFSRSINVRSRSLSIVDVFNQQMTFCKTAQSSTMYSETSRIEYLIALELHTPANFDRICNVAARLYYEVKKSVMDIQSIKNKFLRNNIIMYTDNEAVQNVAITTGRALTDALNIQETSIVTRNATPVPPSSTVADPLGF